MKTKQHRWRRKKRFKTNVKKFNKRYCLAKTSRASKLLNLKKVWILFESVSSWFARRICLLRTPIAVIWFSCSSLHMIVVVCWFCFVYFPFAPEFFFSFLYSVDTWNTFCLISGVDGRFSTKLKCNWELKLVVGILWWNHHSTVKLSEVLTDN